MAAKDLGPLDWRTPIVDHLGRPSPEFQRRWNTQRNNNALIGSITFGSGAPTGTPEDGAEYVDTTATPPAFYVGDSGSWLKIGVFKFTQLSDVPSAYTASAKKLLRVNAGVTGVEFKGLSDVLDDLGATEGDILYRSASGWVVLGPGTAGQVLTTGGTGADPAWAAGGGGGGGGHPYEAFGVLPLAASFTKYNFQANSVLQDSAYSLMMDLPGNGSYFFQVAYQAMPATPFDLYCRFNVRDSAAGSARAGFGLFNSTTKRCQALYRAGNAVQMQIADDTGPTVGATSTIYSELFASLPTWGRVNYNGSNLQFYISADGVNWSKFGAAISGAWAPDSICLSGFCEPSSTGTTTIWVGSFGTTAPT